MAEPERRGQPLLIEATKRLRRASATVERLESREPDDWITGEYLLGTGEDTGQYLLGSGVRSDDVTIQPVLRRRRAERPAHGLERALRLCAALAVVLVVVVFFFEAFSQGVSRLAGDTRPAWRAVIVKVDAEPVRARVIVGDKVRGWTPLRFTERCRGRSIRVRLEARGFATWAWDGLCPARGDLKLAVQLQAQ